MLRRLSRFWLAALLGIAALGPPIPAAPAAAAPNMPTDAKIAPWIFAYTLNDQQAEFLVVLNQQADLNGAAALPTKLEKGRYVVAQLRATAQASQGPLLRWLARQAVPHRPFYIVNAVWVKGDLALAQALAARSDVARVDGNPSLTGLSGTPAAGFPADRAAPNTVEPNIAYVNADDVWALGFTGQGIVVGGQDTGYDWDHPALQPHYRGWDGLTADHDYNWHDSIHSGGGSCGADSAFPCDDNNHGTHTMGTAVGDDDDPGNQIGMAPGAEWIGCRNMNQGAGTPATYLECFEFFLAPYPVGGDPMTDGDPDLAPHVTNNSWSCPDFEGCNLTSLLAAVQAQRAAGIFTVLSAGNTGPSCGSLSEPPAVHPEVYTVGALNTGTDSIANFSARGPVTADGSNRREPDLTAPGTNVRSSINGGLYSSSFSGTSMAAPHVAGAVALLWSARPGLIGQVALTELILNATAVHINSSSCGSSGWPNNTFGYGRLDALAAVVNAPEGAGVLAVHLTDSETAAPIAGAALTATVSLTPAFSLSGLSDPAGYLTQTVFSGVYTLTVTAPGYWPATLAGPTVTQSLTTVVALQLNPAYSLFLPFLDPREAALASSTTLPANHSAPAQIAP